MSALLKKPWFQILLMGISLAAILLIVFGPKTPGAEDKKVLIGNAEVAQLIASWNRTWNRMPTEEELNGLLANHVREEILYREALNQNLDKNNAMVRRGLIMQMNMMAESQAQEKSVSEEAIKAYYDLRKDKFFSSPEYTFTQINFDGSREEEEIKKIAERLNSQNIPPNSENLPGKKGMLQKDFKEADDYTIVRALGTNFESSLEGMRLQTWEGPVKSGFGWHLVYITKITTSETLPLEVVRENIITELQYEEAQAAKEQFYTELRQQYDVVYEGMAKDLMNE
ncbi:peptidyl-prolyl cis-trans isomerase [Gramella lutea]|uniref:peptidylprolyl isomerase n=1 Tax=Christiangramia lutea TaxID=1607951 RepID=A0A9X1V0Z1_9FLAO|nr:peptidylprolyl isomerase [Christiangramia lutea]MCH4822292.1 peptidyl-prolyl cis-trans isomerase [Christiangramia lutea]